MGAPASWLPYALALDPGPDKLQVRKATSEKGVLTSFFQGSQQSYILLQPLWLSLPQCLGGRFKSLSLSLVVTVGGEKLYL